MPNKADRLIQNTQRKKALEFFDVHQKPTALARKPLSVEERQKGWIGVFGKVYTQDSFWVEKSKVDPQALFLCFGNGLRIEDRDTNVSFGAQGNKAFVDQTSAIQTVRMAANHLCRRKDHPEIGSIYGGAEPYVQAFEKATKEATQIMSREQLKALSETR